MKRLSPATLIGIVVLLALPFVVRTFFGGSEKYYLHLLIQILIWSFIYTGWSLMGRFGLTSLGHGAFTGIGAYVMVLLWNYGGITPWIRSVAPRSCGAGSKCLSRTRASNSKVR